MKTETSCPICAPSCLELLEPRLAPAGIIAVSVSPAGVLTLANVAGQDGDEVVTIQRLNDGGYQLTPGAGVTLRIGGGDFASAQTLFGINGLMAKLGAGADSVTLNNCTFTKAVFIDLGQGENFFTMTNSVLGGPLTVIGGDARDSFAFFGQTCAVAGAVTLKMGGGDDLVGTTADLLSFGAGLTVDAGTGDDMFNLATSSADRVQIIGNLNFIGGAGNDTMTIGSTNTNVTITGSIMLNDTAGNETVTLSGARLDAGALLLQAGLGNNTLNSTVAELTLAKNLLWRGTTGEDRVTLTGSELRVGTTLDIGLGSGPGQALVTPTDLLTVGGALTLTTTGVVTTEARDLSVSANAVYVTGKLTLTAGAGQGSVSAFAQQSLNLGAGAVLSAGSGRTNLNINTNGSLVSSGAISMTHVNPSGFITLFAGIGISNSVINGAVTLKGGDGINLNVAGVVTGAVIAETAKAPQGNPGISILGGTLEALHLASTLRATMSSTAGQTGTFFVNNVVFEGVATLTGGVGNDTFKYDSCEALKAMTVNLGAGADIFNLERTDLAGRSLFHGAVILQGGAGADTFNLGGDTAQFALQFLNKVTLDGGADTDTMFKGTQTTYAPGFAPVVISIP